MYVSSIRHFRWHVGWWRQRKKSRYRQRMTMRSVQTEADVTSKMTLEVGDNMADVACGEAPCDRAQDKNT